MLTIGSLFSGIGLLELGLEWSGLGPVVYQCESDPFCQAVLAKHWPEVERFHDVTTVRRFPHVDLVCGGFPCQDVSGAGKGKGLQGKRSGLWHSFAWHVREGRPRVVVVENVASGARKWLCPVRGALQALGYRTTALGISARDVGAPHLRRRIFIVGVRRVADTARGRFDGRREEARRAARSEALGRDGAWDLADADGGRPEGLGGEERERAPGDEPHGRGRTRMGNAAREGRPGTDGATDARAAGLPSGRRGEGGEPLADTDGDALRHEPGRQRWGGTARPSARASRRRRAGRRSTSTRTGSRRSWARPLGGPLAFGSHARSGGVGAPEDGRERHRPRASRAPEGARQRRRSAMRVRRRPLDPAECPSGVLRREGGAQVVSARERDFLSSPAGRSDTRLGVSFSRRVS